MLAIKLLLFVAAANAALSIPTVPSSSTLSISALNVKLTQSTLPSTLPSTSSKITAQSTSSTITAQSTSSTITAQSNSQNYSKTSTLSVTHTQKTRARTKIVLETGNPSIAQAPVANATRRATTHIIDVGAANSDVFFPTSLHIVAGDAVVWSWVSGLHTVTQVSQRGVCDILVNPLFKSDMLGPPGSGSSEAFEFTFVNPGVYHYVRITIVQTIVRVADLKGVDVARKVRGGHVWHNHRVGRRHCHAPR